MSAALDRAAIDGEVEQICEYCDKAIDEIIKKIFGGAK